MCKKIRIIKKISQASWQNIHIFLIFYSAEIKKILFLKEKDDVHLGNTLLIFLYSGELDANFMNKKKKLKRVWAFNNYNINKVIASMISWDHFVIIWKSLLMINLHIEKSNKNTYKHNQEEK